MTKKPHYPLPSRPTSFIAKQRPAERLIHYGTLHGFGVAQLQADGLASLLLGCADLPASSTGACLLALIFDGVLESESLERAWAAIPHRYRTRDGVSIEWVASDDRLERRILGPITCIRGKSTPHVDYGEARQDFARLLVDAGWLPATVSAEVAVEIVISVVTARFLTALPGDLFAHVLGDIRLTAVPRGCLARRDSRLALVQKASPDEEASHMCFLSAAESLESASAKASPHDAEFIADLKRACTIPTDTEDKTTQQQRMRDAVRSLQPRLRLVSRSIFLCWTWVEALAAVGTRLRRPAKPATIYGYPHEVLDDLVTELDAALATGCDPGELDLRPIFERVLAARHRSYAKDRRARAALESFGWTMEDRFGNEPVGPLHGSSKQGPVRANIVWEHEIEWVFARLQERDLSNRFNQQLLLLFALMADPGCAWRSKEFKYIHVAGVDPRDNGCLIMADPLRWAGRGKSRAARRPLEPQLERTRTLLARYRETLARMEAKDEELLFGDPMSPRGIALWARMVAELNRLLKCATGDSSVSLHTLRHTAFSMARIDAARVGPLRFAERSAQGGHAAVTTTRRTYVNIYEPMLRDALDAYWRSFPLTEIQVCGLTGQKPGSLRKRWSRSAAKTERQRQEPAWSCVFEAARQVPAPCVTSLHELRQPVAPAVAPPPKRGPIVVVHALAALALGKSPEATQLRFDFSAVEWLALERALQSWRAEQRGRLIQSGARRLNDAERIPFADGFAHIHQAKLAPVMRALLTDERPQTLEGAAQRWAEAIDRGWISLHDPDRLGPWWDWMRKLGVRGNQWVICYVDDARSVAEDAASWIAANLGEEPVLPPPMADRRGRPPVFLGLVGGSEGGDENGGAVANAAKTTEGLNSLMFSAWVWAQLTRSRNIRFERDRG